jgi:hypothetical protein
MKFPVFSLYNRELGCRDEFARDCFLQRRVSCEPDFIVGIVTVDERHPGQAAFERGLATPTSTVATVVSDGHQCQPSRFIALASIAPERPSGSGGFLGGTPGSPARPETPIIRSFSSKNGTSMS